MLASAPLRARAILFFHRARRMWRALSVRSCNRTLDFYGSVIRVSTGICTYAGPRLNSHSINCGLNAALLFLEITTSGELSNGTVFLCCAAWGRVFRDRFAYARRRSRSKTRQTSQGTGMAEPALRRRAREIARRER